MAVTTIAGKKTRLTVRQKELFGQLIELYQRQGFAGGTLEDTAAVLHCSKSTIYSLAPSREQLVRAVVVAFFRGAAERVDAKVEQVSGPLEKIEAYLRAVAEELEQASEAFMNDVADFGPARETYELNTRVAAGRIRDLISAGVASGAIRRVDATFVADIVSAMMVRIQQREVFANTGLDDATAYQELANFVVSGLRSR
jgi:AcrR family transcriptional regulator